MAALPRTHDATLRIFIAREPDGRYCAEGVDYFLLGMGDTTNEAIESLAAQYLAYLQVAEQRQVEPLFNLKRNEPELVSTWDRAEREGRIETRPMPSRGSGRFPVSRLLIMPVAEAA